MAPSEPFRPGDAVLVSLTEAESAASGLPRAFLGEYVKTAASGRVVVKTVAGVFTADPHRCSVPEADDLR